MRAACLKKYAYNLFARPASNKSRADDRPAPEGWHVAHTRACWGWPNTAREARSGGGHRSKGWQNGHFAPAHVLGRCASSSRSRARNRQPARGWHVSRTGTRWGEHMLREKSSCKTKLALRFRGDRAAHQTAQTRALAKAGEASAELPRYATPSREALVATDNSSHVSRRLIKMTNLPQPLQGRYAFCGEPPGVPNGDSVASVERIKQIAVPEF